MKRRIWVASLLIAILVSLGIFSIKGFGREEDPGEEKEFRVISERIDEVLKNQQDIIARLEDIREQQDIIRIRASRK